MQKRMIGISEWILLVALSVLWGRSFFLIEIALTELPPLTLVRGRVSWAAIAYLIYFRLLAVAGVPNLMMVLIFAGLAAIDGKFASRRSQQFI